MLMLFYFYGCLVILTTKWNYVKTTLSNSPRRDAKDTFIYRNTLPIITSSRWHVIKRQ